MRLFDRKFGPGFLSGVPAAPGVYRLFDDAGVLLYVGKAGNLRRRLGQYRATTRRKPDRKRRALVRAAARIMKPQRSGRIIATTSLAAVKSEAVIGAAYMAAKAGAAHLMRNVALELATYNITVNAIAQGWMQHTALIGDPDPAANKTVRFVPMKRAGAAEDLAGLAVYLASESTGYISGQILYVDGGLSTHL